MRYTKSAHPGRRWLAVAALCGMLAFTGCSTAQKSGLKRVPEGQQYSGFLKDYSNLKPNPLLDGEASTYVNQDEANNLRRYVAVIVDPVEVYVSTKAEESKVPVHAREAVAVYFRHALESAVGSAFPVVESPGPLVLRLRAAIVGVDTGGAMAPMKDAAPGDKELPNAIVLEKVAVEMELVDSVTGKRVAAMVDKAKLGEGAEVGTENFSRQERFAQAKLAFDKWAQRVRVFLDGEHQLTGADAEKADKAYRPYGQ
jgi:hypothetical protein